MSDVVMNMKMLGAEMGFQHRKGSSVVSSIVSQWDSMFIFNEEKEFLNLTLLYELMNLLLVIFYNVTTD